MFTLRSQNPDRNQRKKTISQSNTSRELLFRLSLRYSVHTLCLLVLFGGRFKMIGMLLNVVHARISKPWPKSKKENYFSSPIPLGFIIEMNYKLLLECQVPFGSEFNNITQSLRTTTWRRVKMKLKFNLKSLLPFYFLGKNIAKSRSCIFSRRGRQKTWGWILIVHIVEKT